MAVWWGDLIKEVEGRTDQWRGLLAYLPVAPPLPLTLFLCFLCEDAILSVSGDERLRAASFLCPPPASLNPFPRRKSSSDSTAMACPPGCLTAQPWHVPSRAASQHSHGMSPWLPHSTAMACPLPGCLTAQPWHVPSFPCKWC